MLVHPSNPFPSQSRNKIQILVMNGYDSRFLHSPFRTNTPLPPQKKEYWLSMALALPPSRSSPSTPSSWRRGASLSSQSSAPSPPPAVAAVPPPPPPSSVSFPRSWGGDGGGGRPGGRGGGGGWGGLRGLLVKYTVRDGG